MMSQAISEGTFFNRAAKYKKKQTTSSLLWEAAFVEVLQEHWKAKRGDAGCEELQVTTLTLREAKSLSEEYYVILMIRVQKICLVVKKKSFK